MVAPQDCGAHCIGERLLRLKFEGGVRQLRAVRSNRQLPGHKDPAIGHDRMAVVAAWRSH